MAGSKRQRLTKGEKPGSYYLLLGVVFALSVFGLVMVLSASHTTGLADYNDSYYFFKRQLQWLVIGFGAMFIFASVEFRWLRRLVRLGLIISFALLILVLVPGLGITAGGASRWLTLGPLTFQPSELAKFAMIFFAADILAKRRENITDFKTIAVPVLPVFGVMAVVIMLQPDLGTTLILAGIVLVMLYVADARLTHVLGLAAAGLAAVWSLINIAGYRRARINAFINPWKDPQNTGFQYIQSQIALGSGHWFGVGLGMSKQKFFYLPASHTDFIFAIIGEELGLAGTLTVVAAFSLLVYACIRIAARATTQFDRLVATGITAMIIVQAVLNMGAVTGILPITGVPLPLISSGGTSLLFVLTGVGILLNIASHERKTTEGVIDARDYFRGGDRRASVSRSSRRRNARLSG